MKKQDFLKKLSDMTGIKAEEITAAITSDKEDIEVTLIDKHYFTDEELEARLTNHAKQSGKTFIEMAVKEARNKLIEDFGQDGMFEGKTIENLVAKAKELGEKKANVKPNEALKEKDVIIAKLQENLKTSDSDWQRKYDTAISEKNEVLNNLYIRSILPNDLDTQLPFEKVANLFNMDRKIRVNEDGKREFLDTHGNVLRDGKTQNPLTDKEVVDAWLQENNLKRKTEPGRGEGNEHGTPKTAIADIKNTADFNKYCTDNKIPQGQQAKVLIEVQKVNPNFMLE